MTRSVVAFSRWSLTPGTLLLETIRTSDCIVDEWSPKPKVAQDRFYCTDVCSYMTQHVELLWFVTFSLLRTMHDKFSEVIQTKHMALSLCVVSIFKYCNGGHNTNSIVFSDTRDWIKTNMRVIIMYLQRD